MPYRPHPIMALTGLAAALVGCDGTPEPAEAPCPAPAVAVTVEGETWCAHHDVRRFTCPAELPERHSYQGVAFCGARAVDDATAGIIARTALRTGEVLEQRAIVGFDVPPEWQRVPGAPADTPLDIAARTVTPSNLSWSSADGDPFLCRRTFERFEVELDGPHQLHVSAWDALECGADVVGSGAEQRETLPLTLPGLAPGLYRLGGPSLGHPLTPARLAVELAEMCGEPPPLDTCFRGAFFADCGAAAGIEPSIWCDAEHGHQCVWAECPPLGHLPLDCAGVEYCPTPHVSWGAEPWTRARAMVLDVQVDAGLAVDAPRLECSGGGEAASRSICRTAPDAWQVSHSEVGSPTWRWPGLVHIGVYPDGGFGGWGVMIELDVFAAAGPTARACIVETSDGGANGNPACAANGTLTLDRLPADPDDVAGVHGTLRAAFADFDLSPTCEDCAVRGLEINLRF